MSEKILYGQAWLFEDKLVQDTTIISEGKCYDKLTTLVDNIWEDLLNESSHQYKSNGKGYFYWEYNQTSIDNDDVTVVVNFPCPEPKIGLFTEPLNPQTGSDYAKYWKGKIIIRRANEEKASTIQRKEIFLQGCDYVDQNGNKRTIADMVVNNSSDDDITNLLNTLF